MGKNGSPQKTPTTGRWDSLGAFQKATNIQSISPNGGPKKIPRLQAGTGWEQAWMHKMRRHIMPNGGPEETCTTLVLEQAGSMLGK